MTKAIYVLLISVFFVSCKQEVEKKTQIISSNDSLSYSIGMLYASKLPQNIKDNGIESISYEIFIKGMKDFIDSTSTNAISDSQAKVITDNFLKSRHKSKVEPKVEATFEKFKENISIGEKFLEKNKLKSNVKEIEPGLQVKTVYSGWGKQKPDEHDSVLVFYRIYNTNIELLYDSKVDSNKPIAIALDSAVLAWKKILPTYVTGGKMVIYASYEYAYGNNFSPNKIIKPYETVIFEIELVKFIPVHVNETTILSNQTYNSNKSESTDSL